MQNIQREDIYIISRHSSLTEQGADKILKKNVYHNKEAWQKFLLLFFISLGIGFAASGIVFFFAYNWADLHRFTKTGLIELLIIATTCLVLFLKINITGRNIILTAAAVLVGVLFAVFGQIYQTGANAYDFFLAWTLFITLWVFVAGFAPLWLLYLILINTTLILYAQQVAGNWSEVLVFTLLFIINAAVPVTAALIARYRKMANMPVWFLHTVALAAVISATTGIITGIFDDHQVAFPVLILLTLTGFTLGIWYALKTKNGFYLAIIPFGIIVIMSALFIKISDGEMMFLLVGLFIITSVTLVIKNLVTFQKKWKNEK
ncbi:DUF2157 domain-containing protein [Niabella aquatica]